MSVAIIPAALFAIGLYGVLSRRDLVAVLASVEIMLGSATLLLVSLATRMEGVAGGTASVEAIGVFVLVVAAAEAAVGLGILVTVAYRVRTTKVDELVEVRG